jgi:hypothetical protein
MVRASDPVFSLPGSSTKFRMQPGPQRHADGEVFAVFLAITHSPTGAGALPSLLTVKSASRFAVNKHAHVDWSAFADALKDETRAATVGVLDNALVPDVLAAILGGSSGVPTQDDIHSGFHLSQCVPASVLRDGTNGTEGAALQGNIALCRYSRDWSRAIVLGSRAVHPGLGPLYDIVTAVCSIIADEAATPAPPDVEAQLHAAAPDASPAREMALTKTIVELYAAAAADDPAVVAEADAQAGTDVSPRASTLPSPRGGWSPRSAANQRLFVADASLRRRSMAVNTTNSSARRESAISAAELRTIITRLRAHCSRTFCRR